MIWIGEREITMRRGWIAQLKDGSVICEDDMSWQDIPDVRNIRRLILKWEDRVWSLDDKEHYTVPTKRGYVDVNTGGVSQGVDSRSIGYYDVEGKCKVLMRVDEVTGKMSYEIIPF